MRKKLLGLVFAGAVLAGTLVPTVALANPESNPTDSDCHGDYVSYLADGYGSLKAAADTYGYSVQELQEFISYTCGET